MDRQRALRSAEKLVSKGKLDAAIKQYRKVLDASPRDTTTLNRVGDLYVRAKRLDDAMELFHRAAEHFSDEGFFVKSIAIYKKILRLDPGQLAVYEKLASLYYKQGLNTEAKNQYEVVADYHLKHEDLPAAIGVHEKIVEIVPQDATAHLHLAELYQRADRPEDALAQYREIAVLMLEHGKVDEALRVYRSALEVDASDLDFVKAGVEGLKQAGHLAAARELMSFAVDLNPEAAELRVVDDRRGADADTVEEMVAEEVAEEDAASEAATEEATAAEEDAEVEVVADEEAVEAEGAADVEPAEAEEAEAVAGGDVADGEEVVDLTALAEEEAAAALAETESTEAAALEHEESFEIDLEALEAVEIEEPELEPEDAEPDAADEASVEEAAAEEAAVEEVAAEEVAVEEVTVEPASAADAPSAEATAEEIVVEEVAVEEVPVEEVEETAVEEAPVEAESSVEADAVEVPIEVPAEEVPAEEVPVDEVPVEEAPVEEVPIEEAPIEEAPVVAEPAERAQAPVPSDELAAAMEAALFAVNAAEEAEAPATAEADEERPADAGSVEVASDPEPAAEAKVEEVLEEVFEAPAEDSVETGAEAPAEAPADEPAELAAQEPAEEPAFEPAAVSPDELLPEPAAGALVAEDPGEIDLVAEATVLASYGLYGKAIDRLQELLASSPDRLDARERLVRVFMDQGSLERAAAEATDLARRCFERDERDVWARVRGVLVEAGFEIDRGQVLPPGVQPAAAEEPATESPPGASPEPPTAPPTEPQSDVDAAVAGLAPAVAREDEPAGADASAAPTPDGPTTEAEWLAASGAPEVAAGEVSAADDLFASEDEFFDLAAELEEELDREGVLPPAGELISDIEEQSLDDIVEGFRKGVAEALSPEDFDTHYNLGIAYREMGLVDEAIGEFQLAAKDPRYLVDSCSMLAACFVDKGFPELAIKWFERGLESPAITEDEVLGLRYELGCLYQQIDDAEKAYSEFVEIYGANSNFRDVVAKLEELRNPPSDD